VILCLEIQDFIVELHEEGLHGEILPGEGLHGGGHHGEGLQAAM
jgi:hypothetical protein